MPKAPQTIVLITKKQEKSSVWKSNVAVNTSVKWGFKMGRKKPVPPVVWNIHCVWITTTSISPVVTKNQWKKKWYNIQSSIYNQGYPLFAMKWSNEWNFLNSMTSCCIFFMVLFWIILHQWSLSKNSKKAYS